MKLGAQKETARDDRKAMKGGDDTEQPNGIHSPTPASGATGAPTSSDNHFKNMRRKKGEEA
jgi:hypothetical protein